MAYQLLPGMFDIVPHDASEPWRNSSLWQYVEVKMREIARVYGYREIRTPILERTELFLRSVGETSDIVSKEMYTFQDKGDRSLTLRPEGTAPVIRAVVEGRLHQDPASQKLFYIGPMFRYDRPQAGRYRQHHQFGAEAIGDDSPEQDAEMIDLVYSLYRTLGLNNLSIQLNSIGDEETRQNYRKALQDFLRPHYDRLSADSKLRFEGNPLRILDSKDPTDRAICVQAPSILQSLNSSCRDHFEAVKRLLRALRIPFDENSSLVRGLDYYNRTVFEVVSGQLGAQNSIGGGGRYDGLFKQLGGPDLPTVGFATGIERVIQTMLKQETPFPSQRGPQVFLIALGEACREWAFQILHDLRRAGVAAQMDFSNRKLGKVMGLASQIQAEYVLVLGENEKATGRAELKEMATGSKQSVQLSDLAGMFESDD